MLVFEDETTTITQKPCGRKSMSFEGEQQKIEHNGSRKKEVFSVHIHVMARLKLMYDFYKIMNSIYKHDKPSGESEEICHEDYLEKIDTDMG
jgi:hypothetical protein